MSTLRKILLVDDERVIRSIVGLALGKIGGFTLHVCDSGEQATADAAGFVPDLLLLDVKMPGMDGIATLQRLRDAGIQAPAIFLTAKADPRDVARYAALGALGTIPKPFDPLKLGRQILALWEAHRQGPA